MPPFMHTPHLLIILIQNLTVLDLFNVSFRKLSYGSTVSTKVEFTILKPGLYEVIALLKFVRR